MYKYAYLCICMYVHNVTLAKLEELANDAIHIQIRNVYSVYVCLYVYV